MCYVQVVETVGLRELRQQASELVRRVEEGGEVLITVAGRPSAKMVPIAPRAWRTWDEVSDIFRGPADPDWDEDMNRIDQGLHDPWERR